MGKRSATSASAPKRRSPKTQESTERPGAPEPAEPIVEAPEPAEIVDDQAALEPADDDEGGPVLDVGGEALVRRGAVALPEGEWVQEEGPGGPVVDDEVPPAGRGDALYTAFVREATRVQRLSEEEERALGLKVRDYQDQSAAKKLVVHNLRLAIKMAHQYRRAWTNLMDLVQEASAGMAVAAQRWDPDQGTRFGTYAVYWIRAQLTRFLMTNGRAIHTGNTRAGRKLYFQLPRVRRKLLAEGKEPTIDAIAKEVQEDPIEVARVVARLDGREASLDAQVGPDDDGSTLGELIADEGTGPEHNAAHLEVQKLVAGLMQRFAEGLQDERDRVIWTEHLVAPEPKSLVELGARYGISKQRMGQLATRLKRAFRRHVIDELGPSTQLSWLFATD
ncbi:MAG: sigma-70 family RNA polymerase sigma factor [Deltaproteobacteria bacterium]|nr:sigma-70 family RNA polymerase sigma factor [Deltaproteobacteria bacterium]